MNGVSIPQAVGTIAIMNLPCEGDYGAVVFQYRKR